MTFLCALRNCTVHAIFAGRLRSWNKDLAFWLRNKKVCRGSHRSGCQLSIMHVLVHLLDVAGKPSEHS